MGNCWTCFKEPTSTALDNTTQNKEEMPEVRLYPAPSHVPASSAPPESCLLSNGNHLTNLQDTAVVVGITSSLSAVITTITTAITTTSITPTAGTTTTTVNRLYTNTRRVHSKSAPIMGLIESKSSETKIQQLFDLYKDKEDDDLILAEGIEKLCKDLQISPDNFQILVLAWKLGAEQMCRFTRNEFINGLKEIRCDSIQTIQLRLPEIVKEIEENDKLFRELYKFTFRFALDTNSRNLSKEMAIVLWRLVFTIREPKILDRWLNYLELDQTIRGITSDTWNMFLLFSDTVDDDLSTYNDNDAWPSLFDDFVEYENDQTNQNITKDLKDNNFDSLMLIQNDE